jgi:hypothetical protein
MDVGSIIGILGIFITTGIAVYAILDVRKQVKGLLVVERNLAYAKILNDMSWLFVDPTDKAHSVEIAKGLEEFCLLAEVITPKRALGVHKETVEREALSLAKDLVENGAATWKSDLDLEKVKEELHGWQTEKNAVRIHKIFGEKKSSLF